MAKSTSFFKQLCFCMALIFDLAKIVYIRTRMTLIRRIFNDPCASASSVQSVFNHNITINRWPMEIVFGNLKSWKLEFSSDKIIHYLVTIHNPQ